MPADHRAARPRARPTCGSSGVALRIAHELERSADLMVNVARTTWRLHPARLDATAGPLVDRMGRQVVVQLRVAVNAFVDRDPSWAAALADMDDTIDELERRLFRHVLEVDGGAPVDDDAASTPRCSSRWSPATTSASATTR